jgi:hypothetical protein
MKDKELTQKELDELTRARKPSTPKELTKKATEYILKKAEEADQPPEG